ncbi:hypothetical protein PPERSA_02051 [Pseudocohnilembus persalinus]|uniref:LITAF domain-containing protein n=1 Tax=Pseudocohnilembus persalinus TaxID=266149 RepID=A0A0V0QFF4_PSEPJ|nr:hypothetical protein PPERSA_02051 [Pseudocohnilembus persalinus]|eukprot:KRX00872.1 hypothetical protein PPERSA_02051 [Pseudocohnilembus persalinus]
MGQDYNQNNNYQQQPPNYYGQQQPQYIPDPNNNMNNQNNPYYGQQPYQSQQYPQPQFAQGQPVYNNNNNYQQQQGQMDAVIVIGQNNQGNGGFGVPQTYPSQANGITVPATIQCPNCGQKGVTRVEHKVGGQTILCSIIILCLFWPLFFLPCCMKDCQDKQHYCRNCGYPVGKAEYEIC